MSRAGMFLKQDGGAPAAAAIELLDLRVETVGAQQQFEKDLAARGKNTCSRTAAVFLVPNMLTPLFVNSDEVHQNEQGLYVMNEGCGLPAGLVTKEVESDPAKLSTVLGRAITLRQILDHGAHISIFVVNQSRPTVDKKATVDDTNLKLFLEKYRSQVKVHVIDQAQYDECSAVRGVPAATYHSNLPGYRATCTIHAKQANADVGPIRDWSHFCYMGEAMGMDFHALALSVTNKMLEDFAEVDHISKLLPPTEDQNKVDPLVSRP